MRRRVVYPCYLKQAIATDTIQTPIKTPPYHLPKGISWIAPGRKVLELGYPRSVCTRFLYIEILSQVGTGDITHPQTACLDDGTVVEWEKGGPYPISYIQW